MSILQDRSRTSKSISWMSTSSSRTSFDEELVASKGVIRRSLQPPRFSTQEGVSVRYPGAISRTSRSSSRTTLRRVLIVFRWVEKGVIR